MFKAEVDHKTVEYQPWHPMTSPLALKVLGKALEEAGEYSSALARCLIQGINESEPVSGKPNRQWLEEEMADMLATATLVTESFQLNEQAIVDRATIKRKRLKEWHEMSN